MSRILTSLALVTALVSSAQGGTKEVQKLLKQLKDSDPGVRAEAAWDLGKEGAAEAVPALATALTDPTEAVRQNAAASLGKLGDLSKAAIPALKTALSDPSPGVVGNAAGTLRSLGVPKAELLPAYRKMLASPRCEARVIGLTGLVEDAPPTELFRSAWECSQIGKDSDVRSPAAEVLRSILNRRDRVLLPQILEALKNVGTFDPNDLISAIPNIAPPAKEAVPALVALLSSKNDSAAHASVRALGRMGTTAVPTVPQIAELLGSNAEVDTRAAAAETLGDIGPQGAKAAVPALTKAAEDKWPKVRNAAIGALGKMGGEAKGALPILDAALKDPDAEIRLSALNALSALQPEKSMEFKAIADKAAPVQIGDLWDDPSRLASTLTGKVPEVFELQINDKYASATAPSASSPSGRVTFRYEGGAITGPEKASEDNCTKKIALAKVDFSVVPKIVKQAPGLFGSPEKVSSVTLTSKDCGSPKWMVALKTGLVYFKLDGRKDEVVK